MLASSYTGDLIARARESAVYLRTGLRGLYNRHERSSIDAHNHQRPINHSALLRSLLLLIYLVF